VANGGGADSILQFQLKREGDGMKHCQKMKQMHQARLGFMGSAAAWRCWPEERRHRGGDDVSWDGTNLTGPKNKKIHVVDFTTTNRW
jgi:hypothetical protein